MKKNIFKKIVASLATAAMAVGLISAMPAEEAKAADDTLYVIGDFCGWSWDSCATLTSTDGEIFKGELEVTGDTDICIKTVPNWDSDADKVTYKYNDSETQQTKVAFESAGKYEMTYNKSTLGISFDVKSTVEINWSYDYYIAGPADLGGVDWAAFDTTNAVKMTKNGDVYTLETTVAKDGDYGFCVVEIKSAEGVDATTSWLKDPATGNDFAAAGLKAGKAKFEFNTVDGTCKVTQEAEETTTAAPETTTAAPETTTAAPEITTAAPETTTEEATTIVEETTAPSKKGVAVEVTLSADAKWDKVYLHAWGTDFGTEWPGIEMSAYNGKWYATVDTELTQLSFVVSNGNGEQTVDIVDVSGKDVKLTLGAKNADGKFEATANKVVENETPEQPTTVVPETSKVETTTPEESTTVAPETTTPEESTTVAPETTTAPEATTPAKKGVTVEVTLSADAKWDKVFLHAWGTDFGTQWPGIEMTAKDGKWYATVDTELTKLSFVVSNGNGEQTVDIVDVSGKDVKLTLGAKNAEGKFEAAAKTVTTGTAKPGDSAPIVIMLAVAAVAVGMVVASKKKTICE